ncbi:MAG: hypothetical protein WAN17_00310 [Candidatus Sulfotelmatobacter sp.]
MRGFRFLWFCAAAGLLLGVPLSGQSGMETSSPADASHEQTHFGYPEDWSSRHLLMPGMRAEDVLAAGAAHDPRYVYNMVMRQVAVERSKPREPLRPRHMPRQTEIDWAVSLENGYVPQNQFPAKYQFDVVAENCNSDYIVFGLTVTGTSTQANLVGINNLYTGASPACNSGSPWVAFAYNTVTQMGGQIKTSPVLSVDGTKVAFVESTSAGSYFHVLYLPNPIPAPPSQSGSVLSPLTPTSCTTPTTAGCMTTLTIETSATNSNSSPWVDYNTDTAYVGADNGVLYKITPVFGGGAPALVNDSANWPVAVSTNKYNTILTAPVVDDNAGLIFIGDGEGYLYSVKLASPAKTYSAQQTIGWVYDGTNDGSGASGTGIVDPPIAVTDPANSTTDQVFAFTGCSIVQGIGGAVTQVAANFTTGSATASNTVDLGSASGDGDCTGKNVHAGSFDNAFWLNGSTSGHMIACGFVQSGGVPADPKMYFFPFASHVITSTGSTTFQIGTTKGDECSPLTEFYNGTTDRLFFGVGSTTDGHLESSTVTTSLTIPTCSGTATSSCVSSPSALGGTSGIVIDNEMSNGGTNIYFSTMAAGSVNGQKCNVSGGAANPYCAVKLTQSALQ